MTAFYLKGQESFGYCDKKSKKKTSGCGYYIDDIIVVPVDSLKQEIIWDTLRYMEDRSWDTNAVDSILKNYSVAHIADSGFARLQRVRFYAGLTQLASEVFTELDELAMFLVNNPKVRIEISAHTCNTGPESSNIWRSQGRSDEVKHYLVARGISDDRIESKGFGSSLPLTHNNNEQSRSRNNRIIVSLLDD